MLASCPSHRFRFPFSIHQNKRTDVTRLKQLTMSTQRSVPDKDTQKWIDRFAGIKSETYFREGTGTERCVLWNEIQPGTDTTEWIKLDHSLVERVRR